MGKMILSSWTYRDPNLGCDVHVSLRRDAVRFTARWHDDYVRICCPPDATDDEVRYAISQLAPALLKREQRPDYRIGGTIEVPGYSFHLVDSGRNDRRIEATIGQEDAKVLIGRKVEMGSREATIAISRMLMKIAVRIAPRLLFPLAEATAARIGIYPRSWEISTGRRILGHCNASGRIALSAILVFAPISIREYIICHEIAHLTQMNHAAAFHAVLDAFLDGREAERVRELKAYEWPVIR